MEGTFCVDGVTKARRVNQPARSGAIPASTLHFRAGEINEANDLVKRFHYSRRIPSNVQFVGTLHLPGGLFGDFGEAVAACFFCIPPTRWSEDVLELSRLVRNEERRVPLTLLIRLSCQRLKADGADLLVSFADVAEGHHGGVYQAAGWNYHGQRDRRMDGLLIEGTFVPGRTCNSIYGTRSPDKLRHTKPGWKIEPHYDVGKHLYWRALGTRGEEKAARLKLAKEKYPAR